MVVNKVTAALVTGAALATGAVGASAAEASKSAEKAVVAKVATSNFNDQAKGVVFQRNLERDIQSEPLLIKKDGARYLIHEPTTLGAMTGDGVGRLKSYNEEALVKKFGPLDNIRTYEQYKADAEVLSKTPGLGPKLAEKAFDMGTRIKDVQADIQESGETYKPLVRKTERAP